LLIEEQRSDAMRRLLDADNQTDVWWATWVECASAIARRERQGEITAGGANAALAKLRALQSGWHEVLPSDRLRELALRLLRTHALRAADALQLAAALVAAEEEPATLAFVCLDDRLALAAQREGFAVAP
jgi:predicted nucleic acid-binding protein